MAAVRRAGGGRVGALLRAEMPAVIAALLALTWLLTHLRTPDLAAQLYRANLFDREGLGVWDNNWYAGHHVPGYSLVFPPLGALVGIRVLGALSAVGSALVFRRLAIGHFGSRARAGALWFGVATLGDLMIGRLTFSLGVTVGLAALLALQRRHLLLAAVLAALCSATSPVAGLFLALAGVALVLGRPRSPRPGLTVGVPALAVAGALAIAFPEGGRQPFSQSAFIGALLYTAPLLVLLPRPERTLWRGVAIYLLAVIASKVFDTPMGGNVSRLSAEFSGPLLLCAVWGRVPVPTGLGRHARRLGLVATVAALLALVVFQFNSPVREASKGFDDASLNASYYQPVVDFLRAHPQPIGRLEVPFTLTHWEANYLGRDFALARGWERQLDTRYDALFYEARLTGAKYSAWLAQVGVRWVALPDTRLDPSSRDEGALIRRGLPYLTPVLSTPHWRIFEFTGARPLAQGPARLAALGEQDFTLSVDRPGTIRVLVHFTPYWQIVAGAGCVARAPGGGDWTEVRATRTGPLHVAARFSLGRVFDHGARCTAGAGS